MRTALIFFSKSLISACQLSRVRRVRAARKKNTNEPINTKITRIICGIRQFERLMMIATSPKMTTSPQIPGTMYSMVDSAQIKLAVGRFDDLT